MARTGSCFSFHPAASGQTEFDGLSSLGQGSYLKQSLGPDPRGVPFCIASVQVNSLVLLHREVPTSSLNWCPINTKLPLGRRASNVKFHMQLQLLFRGKEGWGNVRDCLLCQGFLNPIWDIIALVQLEHELCDSCM